MVKTEVTNLKIKKKTENLSETDIVSVIQKQVKQRRESIASYEKASRQDLADKEAAEIKILSIYLPEQLSDEKIKSLISKAITETDAKVKADAVPQRLIVGRPTDKSDALDVLVCKARARQGLANCNDRFIDTWCDQLIERFSGQWNIEIDLSARFIAGSYL